MKTYLINLDRDGDRLQRMTARLRDADIEFERMAAADGRKIDLRQHSRPATAWLYAGLQPPMPGEIGCYVSHRSCWQRIVDENHPHALILEDDCEFRGWTTQVLDFSFEGKAIDVIRLRAFTQHDYAEDRPTRLPYEVAGRAVYSDATFGAGAYLISNAGARTCLKAGKYWFPADRWDIWRSVYGLRSGVVSPLMIVPDGGPSSIRGKTGNPTGRSQFNEFLRKRVTKWLIPPFVKLMGG